MDHAALMFALLGVAGLFFLIIAGGAMVCILGGFSLLTFCRTVYFFGQEVLSVDSESTVIDRASAMNRMSIRRHRDSDDSDYWPSGYTEFQLQQMGGGGSGGDSDAAVAGLPSAPPGVHLPRRGRPTSEGPLPERAPFPMAGLSRASPKKKKKEEENQRRNMRAAAATTVRTQSPVGSMYSPDISMHSLASSGRPLLPMPSLDVMPSSASIVPEASLTSTATYGNTRRTEIRRPWNTHAPPARDASSSREMVGSSAHGGAASAGHVAEGDRAGQSRRASVESGVSTEWQTEYDE